MGVRTSAALCCTLLLLRAGTTATVAGATTATVTIAPAPLGIIISPPGPAAIVTPLGLREAGATQRTEITDGTESGGQWAITISSIRPPETTGTASTPHGSLAVSAEAACDTAPPCDAPDARRQTLSLVPGEAMPSVRLIRGRRSTRVTLTWTVPRAATPPPTTSTVVISFVTGP